MKAKIKVLFLLFLSLLTAQHLWAQTREIDSLQKVVAKTNVKGKIDALAALSKSFYAIDPNKGI